MESRSVSRQLREEYMRKNRNGHATATADFLKALQRRQAQRSTATADFLKALQRRQVQRSTATADLLKAIPLRRAQRSPRRMRASRHRHQHSRQRVPVSQRRQGIHPPPTVDQDHRCQRRRRPDQGHPCQHIRHRRIQGCNTSKPRSRSSTTTGNRGMEASRSSTTR